MYKNTTVKQNITWVACIMVTCLYVFIKYNGKINIANIVSIVLLGIIFFSNLEDNVYMLFFFAPLYLYIYIGGAAFYNFIVLTIAFKRIFIIRERIPKRAIFIAISIFSYELMAILRTGGPFHLYIIKWTIAIFMSFWLLEKPVKNYNHFYAILAINMGTAIIGIATMIQYGGVKVDSTVRDILAGGLSTLDQNTFSFYCLFATIVAISFIFDRATVYQKYHTKFTVAVLFVLSGINLVSGMHMVSKTFFIILIFMIALLILNETQSFKRFIEIIGILAIVFYILSKVPQVLALADSFVGRLNEASNLNELSTGREAIVQEYIAYLFNNPITLLFGTGLFSYNAAIGFNIITHNMTLEIICAWGICGLVLIVFQYCSCYQKLKKMYKNKKEKIVNITRLFPMIVLLTFVQSLALFREDATMFYIVFSIYHAVRLNGGFVSIKKTQDTVVPEII